MPLVAFGVVIGIVVAGWLLASAIDFVGSFGLDLMMAGALLGLALGAWAMRYIAVERRWGGLRIVATAWFLCSMSGCLAVFPAQAWLMGRAQERGDRIADALARFHSREGRYPETLQELIPLDLPAVPVPGQHLFDDDAFEYALTSDEFLADGYSIGHSGTAFTWCTRTSRRPEWLCLD
jgi:hypothetical protein